MMERKEESGENKLREGGSVTSLLEIYLKKELTPEFYEVDLPSFAVGINKPITREDIYGNNSWLDDKHENTHCCFH